MGKDKAARNRFELAGGELALRFVIVGKKRHPQFSLFNGAGHPANMMLQ
jgi:hypothetical protein